MVITAFSRTYDRAQVIDFPNTAYYTENMVMIYKKVNATEQVVTMYYKVSCHVL